MSSIFILSGGWQVSGVAFDSFWSPPNSDGSEENVMYRFGSVGQVSFLDPYSHNFLFYVLFCCVEHYWLYGP